MKLVFLKRTVLVLTLSFSLSVLVGWAYSAIWHDANWDVPEKVVNPKDIAENLLYLKEHMDSLETQVANLQGGGSACQAQNFKSTVPIRVTNNCSEDYADFVEVTYYCPEANHGEEVTCTVSKPYWNASQRISGRVVCINGVLTVRSSAAFYRYEIDNWCK